MALINKLTTEKVELESYLDSERGAKLEQNQLDRLETLNSLLGTGGNASSAKQDTIIANLGQTNDSPASSDIGTFSIIAFVKRALQNWTTLLSRIPSGLAVSSGRLLVNSSITPPSKIVTLTFTRVANTNNYAIDDQWGDLRQESSFGLAGEGYWLTAINLVSSLSTLPTGYGSFSLFIFNSSANAGSGIADNDPMTRRTFAIQSGSGINLTTPSKAANDLTANSYTGNLREQVQLTGTDLWFRLVTRTAITSPLAAADTITLTLRFAGMS